MEKKNQSKVQDARFNNLSLVTVAQHLERDFMGLKKKFKKEEDLLHEGKLLEWFRLISQTDFFLLKEFFGTVRALFKDPRQEKDYLDNLEQVIAGSKKYVKPVP